MAEDFKIQVSLTKSEIARYNFHHIRWIVLLDAIGFILLMVGVYLSVTYPDPEIRNTLSSLVVWAAVLLAVGLSQPFILFLQIYVFNSPQVLAQMAERTYCFDDEGVHIHSGEKRATMPWSRIVALKDVGRVFLIYTSPRLAYIIPKRYFPSIVERKRFADALLNKLTSISGQVSS